jgi:colanic acid/amylovoran biosynthesis glycosyltransferase
VSAHSSANGRVLHVVSHYGLLSEGFVADTVSEVERFGWESWVLTREVAHRDVFPTPPDERIRVWQMPSGRRLRRLSPELTLAQAGRATLPHVRAIGPRILHANFGWNTLDVVRAARACRLPLVATFHASDVTVFPALGRVERLSPLWRRQHHRYGPVFEHLDAGLAVSEFVAGKVRDLGYEGRIEIVPAGVRTDRFPFRIARAEGDEIRLLFIGRLVRRKGLDVLLRALPRSAHAAALRLEVVGDGPERQALERLAQEAGVADRVHFLGALPRPEVLEALHRNDVLVMSSRTMPNGEVEGSPVVTKEALAVGLPVVATDNGGTRETIPPAHRDEIVPEENEPALAAAIDRLVDQRASWPQRSQAGRRYVESEFAWDRLAQRITEIYEDTIMRYLPAR